MTTAPVPPPPAARAVPGGLLLRWPMLAALGVLVVNDHLFKATYTAWWTGKLSGVAAMVVVPFFVLGVVEVVRRRPAPPPVQARVLAGVGAAISVAMIGVELVPWVSSVYEVGFGLLRWPLDVVLAVGVGEPVPGVSRVAQTMDPTDLVTVPAGLAPWAWARHVPAGQPT